MELQNWFLKLPFYEAQCLQINYYKSPLTSFYTFKHFQCSELI